MKPHFIMPFAICWKEIYIKLERFSKIRDMWPAQFRGGSVCMPCCGLDVVGGCHSSRKPTLGTVESLAGAQLSPRCMPRAPSAQWPPRPDVPLSLQVTLDLSQHQGIAVRRVLNTERDVVNKFGVTSFPSCYLLSRNGSFSRVPA